MGAQAAITGVGMSRFRTRRQDATLPELLQEGASLALADAETDMAEVDMVVLAQAPDPMHGIGHPEQLAAGALGLGGKPLVRAHTGGATGSSAAQIAWWAVCSGRCRRVLVVGAEKMGDNVRGAQEVLNRIWDPAYESAPLPLNTISMIALAVVRYMGRYGATEEQYARIASRMREMGTNCENAHLREAVSADDVMESPLLYWPIRRGMSCPRSSGACAVVLASPEVARRSNRPVAWIRGFGARANTYFMGDKMGDAAGENDHATLYELQLASEDAYRQAGIDRPSEQIDVAEPYTAFSPFEPNILEAMKLAPPGRAAIMAEEGHWDMSGPLPVNPSGGVVCSNPISTTALVRIAEAAQQVRGLAGGHQVKGAKTAAAMGAGGSVQFFATTVLSSDPGS